MGKGVYGDLCGQRRHRSDCASAQSDQGLRCPPTETLYTVEYKRTSMARTSLGLWIFVLDKGILSH